MNCYRLTTIIMVYSTLSPPLDLSHHFSSVTKRREASETKSLYKYFFIPGIANLAGGAFSLLLANFLALASGITRRLHLCHFVNLLRHQACQMRHTSPMIPSKLPLLILSVSPPPPTMTRSSPPVAPLQRSAESSRKKARLPIS